MYMLLCSRSFGSLVPFIWLVVVTAPQKLIQQYHDTGIFINLAPHSYSYLMHLPPFVDILILEFHSKALPLIFTLQYLHNN